MDQFIQPCKKAALIATLGTEPQVVTAVMDLLIRQGENITNVIVIHTTSSEAPIENAVTTLQHFFDSPKGPGNISFQLSPIATEDDQFVLDVATPIETQAAFRSLYNEVCEVKNAGFRVHLSIAGGRKTMAVFGTVTAQLLFDDDDRLWHLYSGGEFLESKRLHPKPGDDVHLIPIPVVQWSNVAPILLNFKEINDPLEALSLQREFRLKERLEDIRAFILGLLSPAEERVVGLLVRTGLSDNQIAEQCYLSPRTVEQHLRAAYRKASDHWGLSAVGRTQLIALLNLYYSTQITGNPG